MTIDGERSREDQELDSPELPVAAESRDSNNLESLIHTAVGRIDETIEHTIFSKIGKKDNWEKTQIISSVFSGVVVGGVALTIALIGSCVSTNHQANQAKMQRIEVFEKFIPLLESDGPKQKAALLSIKEIAGADLAIQYARMFDGKGIYNALVEMFRDTKDSAERAKLRRAIEEFVDENPAVAALNEGELKGKAVVITKMTMQTSTRLVPVTRMQTEIRTRSVPVTRMRPETRVRTVEKLNEATGQVEKVETEYQVMVPYVETVEQEYTVAVPYQETMEQTIQVPVPTQVEVIQLFREYDDPDLLTAVQSVLDKRQLRFDELLAEMRMQFGIEEKIYVEKLTKRLQLLVDSNESGFVRLLDEPVILNIPVGTVIADEGILGESGASLDETPPANELSPPPQPIDEEIDPKLPNGDESTSSPE